MQQRQPRLGDILDDYCPRERRLTNHAVVAMIGHDIKQTRCTTCDTDHEYKHAKVPRQRQKVEPAALTAPVGSAPKRVVPEVSSPPSPDPQQPLEESGAKAMPTEGDVESAPEVAADHFQADQVSRSKDEGPVHRQLIRAQLPRIEGQPAQSRPAPDFSIRQPAGRQNRFRPRHQQGGAAFQTPSSRQHGSHGANLRGGASHQAAGRPPATSHLAKRHGQAGKRSK